MVNNFKQIKELLEFESEDDFYHLQILKRKKEYPELGSNSATIKTYYLKSFMLSRMYNTKGKSENTIKLNMRA